MSPLYFAYGSNLKATRMRERLPAARSLFPAQLHGSRLAIDKRSSDGSGKANLVIDPSACVWGFLYKIDRDAWQVLDSFEPDYARAEVEVVLRDGRRVFAQTYRSAHTAPGLVAFDWYKRLIVEGALERELPPDYVEILSSLPSVPDPRRST